MNQVEEIVGGAIFLLGIALGVFMGYAFWFAPVQTPTKQTFAAGYTQKDGSQVATRVPMQTPPPPPHVLPKGSKELERVTFKVKPNPPLYDITNPGTSVECSAADVAVSIVKDKDGGTRAVVSSDNGQIMGAVHIPILDTPAPALNFAQLSVTPQHAAQLLVGHSFRLFGAPVAAAIGLDKPVTGKIEPVLAIQYQW